MSSLLGIAREGDEYYVLNITENYKTKLVNWFDDLARRISHSLKSDTSIVLIGPHGVGKSVLARYVAAQFVGEYYAVIDLGVDVATFDSLLEILHEVPEALGFYDPLGITFYDSPMLPRTEPAQTWMSRCKHIVDRALYLATREAPSLIVLPYSLYNYSPCREYIENHMKLIDVGEYLRNTQLREALEAVFAAHAASLGCRSADASHYISYVLKRHGDLSGVFAMAAYGGRIFAKNKCADLQAEDLYKEALEDVANLYGQLYRDLFFPTCREARTISLPLLLSLRGQHLPYEIVHPLSNVEQISRRLSILSRVSTWSDAIKPVAEEILEELRELYYQREEYSAALRWCVDRKESIVTESLKIALQSYPCISPIQDAAQKLRIVYRGLIALSPDSIVDFAKAIAQIAIGRFDICKEKFAKYICNGEEIPSIVIEALALGRRITLETATTPFSCGDGGDLVQAALVDARRASLKCIEGAIDALYREATTRGVPLDLFYKFFRDYIEVALSRYTPSLLRRLALVHYFSKSLPQEASQVLRSIIKTAYEHGDYKTVEAAAAALARLSPEEAVNEMPKCDCPYLRAVVAYRVAKVLAEREDFQNTLKALETALEEAKKGDERHKFTQEFLQEIEELYRQAALEVLL